MIIPIGIKEITDYKFKNDISLKEVHIPNCVFKIGKGAFAKCTRLQNINISDSVIEIGEKAFYGCIGIKKIVLPTNLKEINEGLFYGCDNLEIVELPGSLKYIHQYAFAKCACLKNLYIPSSVINIENNVFKDSGKLHIYIKRDNMVEQYLKDNSINYTIIDDFENSQKRIGYNCKVEVYDLLSNEIREFIIVEPYNKYTPLFSGPYGQGNYNEERVSKTNSLNNVISSDSPIGKALFGRKKGDNIILQDIRFQVRNISNA